MKKLPNRGPCGLKGGGCDVREHHLRSRKTGPKHLLVVARCYKHKRAFTIYPAGYVPYARTSLSPSPKLRKVSVFLAALDAGTGGKRWCNNGTGEPSWPTQQRHIARAGGWLGLCGGLRDRAAEELGIALHEHGAARWSFQRGGYRNRGKAVVAVLALLEDDGEAWVRLVRVGEAVGLCGRGYRVGPHGELRPLFRSAELGREIRVDTASQASTKAFPTGAQWVR